MNVTLKKKSVHLWFRKAIKKTLTITVLISEQTL